MCIKIIHLLFQILLHEDEDFEYYKVAINQDHPDFRKIMDEKKENWPRRKLWYVMEGSHGYGYGQSADPTEPKSNR